MRVGEGNLKAVVVLLVVGLVAQMGLRGVLSLRRVFLLDLVRVLLAGQPDLPSLLARHTGISLAVARWRVCVPIALPALAHLGHDKTSM